MRKARDRCLPMNFTSEDLRSHTVARDRMRIGGSLADIDPMTIDKSVSFDSVGGLETHVHALKEMVVFPLLYPEVRSWYKLSCIFCAALDDIAFVLLCPDCSLTKMEVPPVSVHM